MAEAGPEVDAGIPDSPEALMAMQEHREERPEKPEYRTPARARQVLDLIDKLDTSPLEDQLIALSLVRKLEAYHDRIVEELQDDDSARHAQIAAWAIDADRLFQSRRLLESVDLE
jgi:hypothetical protein